LRTAKSLSSGPMRSLLWTLALLAFSAGAGDAGAVPPRIVAGAPVWVSGDRPGVPHVEPFLAADPTDPELLFGAAVTWPDAGHGRGSASVSGSGIEETTVAGFRSLDGGHAWARIPFAPCLVDPWVSFGTGRDVYLSCLARGGSVAVFRSPDGGRTWHRPVRVSAAGGGGADHPILAVDRSEGPRRGAVYVTFAQLLPSAAPRRKPRFGTAVASSRDGGRSFSTPAFLRHDGLNQQPFDATVLADGTLVLLFMDYASFERPLAGRQAWAARSMDGGRSFSIAALPFEPPGGLTPVPLAADPAAAHRGRLYLAVAGLEPREAGDALAVLRSDDGGASWQRSARSVSPLSVAGDQLAAGRRTRTPAIAVNAAGIVGLAWYDTGRDPRGECFDVDFSASLDGGRSFLAPVRVTPEMSCPPAGQDRAVAARWPFGGDYSGLAATADGRFRVFWSGSRDGVDQVWTAAVEVVAQ
ncbi:MAG TPA: sialidase family protein, partial [Thermoanaerobaculia bacterium]|nr:sialidase family protein [Thermoanaerobaculia bacterium]